MFFLRGIYVKYTCNIQKQSLQYENHRISIRTEEFLLCDYHKNSTEKSNIRVVIDPMKIEINKKGNLLVYISIDFKLPVRGVNPKYNTNVSNKRNNGKNFEYITGKKIKIEIPL